MLPSKFRVSGMSIGIASMPATRTGLYRPLKDGFRFSMNAFADSWKSSLR